MVSSAACWLSGGSVGGSGGGWMGEVARLHWHWWRAETESRGLPKITFTVRPQCGFNEREYWRNTKTASIENKTTSCVLHLEIGPLYVHAQHQTRSHSEVNSLLVSPLCGNKITLWNSFGRAALAGAVALSMQQSLEKMPILCAFLSPFTRAVTLKSPARWPARSADTRSEGTRAVVVHRVAWPQAAPLRKTQCQLLIKHQTVMIQLDGTRGSRKIRF